MTSRDAAREAHPIADPVASPMPVFILGMLQRTGTNYVRDLLVLHPDCAAGTIGEDHLVRLSDRLVDYADQLAWIWTQRHGAPDSARTDLLHSLGSGILAFLQRDAGDKRVVTKMPSVERLDSFFDLFPDTPLLVVVRDGRDVVESGVRSFDWSYETAIRRWATAARTVLDFDARERGRGRPYRIVRYEDLLSGARAPLADLLDLVGLDAERFDFDAAAALPVRGSSDLRHEGGVEVHWDAVARPEGFDPVRRWQSWPAHLQHRFDRLAGAELRALGYDAAPVRGGRLAAWPRARIGDLRWAGSRLRRAWSARRRSRAIEQRFHAH